MRPTNQLPSHTARNERSAFCGGRRRVTIDREPIIRCSLDDHLRFAQAFRLPMRRGVEEQIAGVKLGN